MCPARLLRLLPIKVNDDGMPSELALTKLICLPAFYGLTGRNATVREIPPPACLLPTHHHRPLITEGEKDTAPPHRGGAIINDTDGQKEGLIDVGMGCQEESIERLSVSWSGGAAL